jgi:hypothetical protein
MVYSVEKQNDRALGDFNQAISLDPRNAEAFVGRRIIQAA